MFGNLTGWIISAVIVVLAAFLGNQLMIISQPTAGSGWVNAKLGPLGLDDTARAMLPPMNNLKDDAGDLYRQASADYERNKTLYETLQKARDLNEVDYASLAGLNDLVQAAGCPSMDLFKSKPAEAVGFAPSVTVLDDLEEIAKAAQRVAALAKVDKNYDLARKYAEAVQALGWHLYKERVVYDELSTAESLLGSSDRQLSDIDQDQNLPDKAAAIKAFETARREEYDAKIDPAHKVLAAIGPQNLIDHAGDYFLLAADKSKDRVWRVYAIRRIGHLHFDAENKADQVKSRKFLARMAADPAEDPVIQAAATAAVNMTGGDNQSSR
jgi:hypothetical protein